MSDATTLVGLFSKLFDPERVDITPEAAECLLKVNFDQDDRDRVHELVQKNSRGELTSEEDREFEKHILAGDLLTILHLKAPGRVEKCAGNDRMKRHGIIASRGRMGSRRRYVRVLSPAAITRHDSFRSGPHHRAAARWAVRVGEPGPCLYSVQ